MRVRSLTLISSSIQNKGETVCKLEHFDDAIRDHIGVCAYLLWVIGELQARFDLQNQSITWSGSTRLPQDSGNQLVLCDFCATASYIQKLNWQRCSISGIFSISSSLQPVR
jgi:hypothetical protein